MHNKRAEIDECSIKRGSKNSWDWSRHVEIQYARWLSCVPSWNTKLLRTTSASTGDRCAKLIRFQNQSCGQLLGHAGQVENSCQNTLWLLNVLWFWFLTRATFVRCTQHHNHCIWFCKQFPLCPLSCVGADSTNRFVCHFDVMLT